MILVTGGAVFIGCNFVLEWFKDPATSNEKFVNPDVPTCAGDRENLASLEGNSHHVFGQGSICDRALIDHLFEEHQPREIVHFAAASHRSIHGPGALHKTNSDGKRWLLEASRALWSVLCGSDWKASSVHHRHEGK